MSRPHRRFGPRCPSSSQTGPPSARGRLIGGFTLIELLVVVAIIALLISILLPSLNRAREQARMLTCSSMFRQIGNANQYYMSDFQNKAIPGRFVPANPDQPGGDVEWVENTHLRSSLGRGSVYGGNPEGWDWWITEDMACPNAAYARERDPEYAQAARGESSHSWVEGLRAGFMWGHNTSQRPAIWAGGNNSWHLPLDMREPSQKLFFMDSLDWNTPPWRTADYYREWGELGYAQHSDTFGTWAFRHLFDGQDGRMNGLFFDGSVRNLAPEQIDPAGPDGSWRNQRRLWFPYDEWGDGQDANDKAEIHAIFANDPSADMA